MHHQAGRLAEAEALYRQILAAQPDHFERCNARSDRRAGWALRAMAVEFIRRAIAVQTVGSRKSRCSNPGMTCSRSKSRISANPQLRHAKFSRAALLMLIRRGYTFRHGLISSPKASDQRRAPYLPTGSRDQHPQCLWLQRYAAQPERIEYIFGINRRRHADRGKLAPYPSCPPVCPSSFRPQQRSQPIITPTVAATHGKLIICAQDDIYPPSGCRTI